jgi:WD40 repeat protein
MLGSLTRRIGGLRTLTVICLAVALFSATDRLDAGQRYQPSAQLVAQKDCVGHLSYSNITFSPDGKYLLSEWGFYTAAVWDVATGVRLHTIENPVYGYESLSFSPDSNYVLSGTWTGKAILWDRRTGGKLHTFQHEAPLTYPENNPVTVTAFSSDGKYILTADERTGVYLWDARTWTKRHFFAAVRDREAVRLSPEGKHILIESNNGAVVWEIDTGKKVHSFDDWYGEFSPNGKHIITYRGGNVTLWDAYTFTQVHTFDGDGEGRFSPNSKYLVTENGRSAVWLWTLTLGFQGRNIQPVFAGVASFSSDSKHVIGMIEFENEGDSTVIGVWDIATGAEIRRFNIGKVANSGIHTAPDSSQFLFGVGEGELQLWDFQTGKKVRQFC